VTITGTQTTSLVYGEVLRTYEIIIRVSFHITKFASVFEIKKTRKNSKVACLFASFNFSDAKTNGPS